MSPPDVRRRPVVDGAAITKTSGQDTSTIPRSDLAARARRHDYGVRVLAERRDGIVTSQVYADLPAAERKVARTQERGLRAELLLVRLLPVGVLPLAPSVPSLERLLDEAGGPR